MKSNFNSSTTKFVFVIEVICEFITIHPQTLSISGTFSLVHLRTKGKLDSSQSSGRSLRGDSYVASQKTDEGGHELVETSSRVPWWDTGRRPTRRARTVEERGGAQGVCGTVGAEVVTALSRDHEATDLSGGTRRWTEAKSLKIKMSTKKVSSILWISVDFCSSRKTTTPAFRISLTKQRHWTESGKVS